MGRRDPLLISRLASLLDVVMVVGHGTAISAKFQSTFETGDKSA